MTLFLFFGIALTTTLLTLDAVRNLKAELQPVRVRARNSR